MIFDFSSVKEVIEYRVRWSIASPVSLKLVDNDTKEPVIYNLNVDLVDYKHMILSHSHIKTPQFFKQYGSPFVNGHANQIDWEIERGNTVWGTYYFVATNNQVKGLTKYFFLKNLEHFCREGYMQYYGRVTSDKMANTFIEPNNNNSLKQTFHFMVHSLPDIKSSQRVSQESQYEIMKGCQNKIS